jgi:hypothetical protein
MFVGGDVMRGSKINWYIYLFSPVLCCGNSVIGCELFHKGLIVEF